MIIGDGEHAEGAPAADGGAHPGGVVQGGPLPGPVPAQGETFVRICTLSQNVDVSAQRFHFLLK